LDDTENQAWQKLLRVMTHEIMNSLAPISSLVETLRNLLSQSREKLATSNLQVFDDIVLGMKTIKKRSEGLLKFALTFRNLYQITMLNLKQCYISDLFENMHRLMLPTLQQREIETEIILKDTDIILKADVELLEQVCINLPLNAMEAIMDVSKPHIIMSVRISNNRSTYIKIADHGPGVAPDVLDKIFIPFFSTKRSGSDIGLSLCKQIMALHKGSITVQSSADTETVLSLLFKLLS
jgi:C4-dicarboxylate-specific signal transduction histidine kinase